ncbi:hypothetical protein EJB05_42039, partial [Eragrostis curvula]
MAAPSPFHRWKRFFPAFDAIHGAIEGADPASLAKDELGCARYLQSAKAEVVEILCDFPWNHEDYCQILDDLMVEYLVTLKTVPVTADRACAVVALEEHESEKIRGLARELIHQWRLSDEALAPKNRTPVVGDASNRVESAKREGPAKISAPLPKKSAPVVGIGRDSMAMMVKMEATKRKLREGYQEAADAKRQRKIVLIEAPKMAAQQQRRMHPVSQAKRATSTAAPKSVEKRQRKVHPIIRERSQARCAASTAVRRSLMPSFCRV